MFWVTINHVGHSGRFAPLTGRAPRRSHKQLLSTFQREIDPIESPFFRPVALEQDLTDEMRGLVSSFTSFISVVIPLFFLLDASVDKDIYGVKAPTRMNHARRVRSFDLVGAREF